MSPSIEKSARVDIQKKSCGCDMCHEELIVVYHVRIGRTVWVTTHPEHVCAFAEFMGSSVLIWTQLMTRRQYQSIPGPGHPALN